MSTLEQIAELADLLSNTVNSMAQQAEATKTAFTDIIEISKGAAETMQAMSSLQKIHQEQIIKLQDRVCTLEEKVTGLGH